MVECGIVLTIFAWDCIYSKIYFQTKNWAFENRIKKGTEKEKNEWKKSFKNNPSVHINSAQRWTF